MAEETSESLEGCSGCLYGLGILMGGAALVTFLQWLWDITVAIAIWLWMAPGRLLSWILSWPFFSGHLLLSLLGLVAGVALGLLLAELLLRWLWLHRFLAAGSRASLSLHGRVFRRGSEVIQLSYVEFCDHNTSTASVRFLRCKPRSHRNPDLGIKLCEFAVANINITPDNCRGSKRLRTLRQPTRTYVESFGRHGLELLDHDSIEAKAWQALLDSSEELERLDALLNKANGLLEDARSVLRFRNDNELVSPVRNRSLALIPKLTADVDKINERSLALQRFGYKLYEFLNIPASLRSADLCDDMASTLITQRGMSDELFDEIRLIEQSYGELLQFA